MNVVDSSAWLEYLTGGPDAAYFAPAIEQVERLVVPSITIYEVAKQMSRQVDTRAALSVTAVMRLGRVVDLDATLAFAASSLSLELDLPLADSVILATARRERAVLWTQDGDFEGLPGVKYRAKETRQ